MITILILLAMNITWCLNTASLPLRRQFQQLMDSAALESQRKYCVQRDVYVRFETGIILLANYSVPCPIKVLWAFSPHSGLASPWVTVSLVRNHAPGCLYDTPKFKDYFLFAGSPVC